MPVPGDVPITAAVLGQGSIGRRHAGVLSELGCRVRTWDPAHDRTGSEAGAEDALAGADVAVVASPSIHHREQIALALDHGCHVLVEKPPATTAEGLLELATRAEAERRVVAVAFNLRFHPGPEAVADIIRSGGIGRPLTAQVAFGSYLPDWRPGTDYRESYSARAELGGGILLDAIHELDYAGWVLGPAVDVDARLARVSELELDVEDTAILTSRHSSGALSTITLDFLDRVYHRGCRIVGSEASVAWSWEGAAVRLLAPGGVREIPAPSSAIAESYQRQMRAFLEAVATGVLAPPLCGLGDAAATMRLADAAREADTTGRRVTLRQ